MLEQRALDCVQKPLESTPPQRRFAPGVAKALIDQLLLLKTTGPDGKPIEAKDQFVELVQLQVVCQSLWEQLKPDDYEIGMDDLASADPSKALLNFYERCIVQTAERTGVPENKIRRWFERDLITPAGTRGTVFRGGKRDARSGKCRRRCARKFAYHTRGSSRVGVDGTN